MAPAVDPVTGIRTPTWDELHSAWQRVGADAAGLSWDQFVTAARMVNTVAAPQAQQPADVITDPEQADDSLLYALRIEPQNGTPYWVIAKSTGIVWMTRDELSWSGPVRNWSYALPLIDPEYSVFGNIPDADTVAAQDAGKAIAVEELAKLLPYAYYMDPPDGGDVSLLEQLRRMSEDAARYRKLRNEHWSNGRVAVVANPKEVVRLGSYCPSGELLDKFIDSLKGE